MPVRLSDRDRHFLDCAIDISRRALKDEGKTPFGAIIVINDEIISEGTSSVVEQHDPTAHAEIMALRRAGEKLERHLMPDAVMYASSEPCPMCLIACYWAQVPRLVFAATTHDVAMHGFEDLWFYHELTRDIQDRILCEDRADDEQRRRATAVLTAWTQQLPEPVTPKL